MDNLRHPFAPSSFSSTVRKYYKNLVGFSAALTQRAKRLRAETPLSSAEARSRRYAVVVVVVVVILVVAKLYICRQEGVSLEIRCHRSEE